MQTFSFSNGETVLVQQSPTIPAIHEAVEGFLSTLLTLPENKDARILLKPNFNNDLNALMSNSTDLRLIVAVVQVLQKRGYRNITIADGPNGGVVRRGVDVFTRLRIDRLSKVLNVKYLDLNKSTARPEKLTNDEPVEISEACIDADVLINLPKIKTHWEAGLTLSSKNIMGCLKGFSKKKMHFNFFPNLVRLNEIIKPNLHIVDGLVAMEGQGPGDGRPRTLNLLIAGTNNYLVDLVVARLVGFEPSEVGYLDLAIKRNLIPTRDVESAMAIQSVVHLTKSHQSKITKVATARWLTPVRNLARPIFQHPVVNSFLIRHNIMQDAYVDEDDRIEKITVDPAANNCTSCVHYCPMGLDPHTQIDDPKCIKCLYCFMTCKENAFTVHGKLGFLESQIERFRDSLKRL